uniref:Minor tail protein n=1 Tax=Siphoviridae sp. ct2kB26 TaxID=2825317 RepID=A0A8S5P7W6_9CAUD|nr:MAG TPA: minor tail protein [Siphoviridae sp. ct2kB26]
MGSMMSAINRSTSKLNSAISGMNKVLGAAGIAVSLAGIVSAAKNAAAAFNEVQENNAALAQVMKNTMGATKEQWRSVLDLADAQQRLGVIDAEVTKAGAVELATYLGLSDSLKTLIPVMNDMLAQQYGMAASSENAANIATMLGKVMNGQTGALSRYGYSFTAAQEAILKYGDEAQRAAVLAQVVEESVGGMNQALAQTPAGRLQQVKFALGDIQEAFGKAVMTIATAFLPLLNAVVAVLQKIAAWAGRVAQAIANVFGAKTKTVAAAGGGIGAAAGGINDAADAGDNLSDAMGGAAKNTEKAAKAAQKLSALGIDELNQLQASSEVSDASSSSGGGSAGGAADIGGGITGIDWSAAEEAGESSTALEKILRRLKETVDKMDFSKLEAAWGRLKESAKNLGSAIGDYLGMAYNKVLEPLAVWWIDERAPSGINLLADALYALGETLRALEPVVGWFLDDVLQPLAARVGEISLAIEGDVGTAFRAVGDFFSGKTVDTTGLYNAIGEIGDFLGLKALSMMGDIGSLMDKFDSLKTFTSDVCHALQASWQGVMDFFSDVPGWIQSNLLDPVVNDIKSKGNSILSAVERVINGAISGINWMIGQLNRIQIEIPDWVPGIGGGTLGFNIGTIGAVSLPRLESGGVMQSAGLFWANENGKPEMVGRMGGHAAVANNDQIVEGITYGVREANDDVVTAIYAVAQQIIGAMREQDGGSGEFDLGRYIARQQRETARMNG